MTSSSTVTLMVEPSLMFGQGPSVPHTVSPCAGGLAGAPGFAFVHIHVSHSALPSRSLPWPQSCPWSSHPHHCSEIDFLLLKGCKPTPFTTA